MCIFYELLLKERISSVTMSVLTVENSEIKGYHHFQRRPIPEIGLQVLPEEQNIWDSNAMAIYMPRIADIPKELHNYVTRTKSSRHPEDQRVCDIAGMMVGRVKANLCKVLKEGLLNGDISSLKW